MPEKEQWLKEFATLLREGLDSGLLEVDDEMRRLLRELKETEGNPGLGDTEGLPAVGADLPLEKPKESGQDCRAGGRALEKFTQRFQHCPALAAGPVHTARSTQASHTSGIVDAVWLLRGGVLGGGLPAL